MDVCYTKWELFEFAYGYAQEFVFQDGLGAGLLFPDAQILLFRFIPQAAAYCTTGLPT